MSSENPYKELRKALAQAGGAIPAIPVKELFTLLQALFTAEEASLAVSLPKGWVTAKSQAEATGRPWEEISAMLEIMTDKGLLHARKGKGGDYEYRIMPLLPGIYEMQFYRGTKEDRDYLLARLFKDYLETMSRLRDSLPQPLPIPETSYFRVLPVEKEVEASTQVLPYSRITRYVEETEAIAVGTCFCRHHAILLDKDDRCSASHDNCMAFGEGAVFVADRKMGRLIDKAEALRIVQRAEEEGLVHCSANTSEELAFICNCCTCHCGILRQAKRFPHASRFLTSGYQARVRADRCVVCEACAQRCPMKAIAMNESAEVQPLQCIGCGLCVGACPSEAMELIPRPDVTIPPKKMGDLEKALRKKESTVASTAGSL